MRYNTPMNTTGLPLVDDHLVVMDYVDTLRKANLDQENPDRDPDVAAACEDLGKFLDSRLATLMNLHGMDSVNLETVVNLERLHGCIVNVRGYLNTTEGQTGLDAMERKLAAGLFSSYLDTMRRGVEAGLCHNLEIN